jgi:hypothetical protein
MGDAREFKNVWFGEKMKSFRKNHAEGNIPGICKSCYKLQQL